MKLWKRCLALPLFSFLQNAICYTVRILRIMNTFSILDDFIFFSFFFFFFFHKKSTRKLYIRHPSLSICGTHQPVTVAPPPFPQSLQTSLSKNGFILSTSRFTTSRACGFGKISRDCLDLLDIPFHTFSLCFPHVSGSEIFIFFSFLIFFLAHPSPAHPSRLISGRKRQKD